MIDDALSGATVFLAVADKRGFSAAARSLGVTPSAVSQAIAALERRVGIQLVQRTTRSVGLTEAGSRLAERLRPAMVEMRSAFDVLGDLKGTPTGTLRIAVSTIACRRFLEPSLARFMTENPELTLDIVVEDGLTDIVALGVDAGIRLGESVERDMIVVPISPPERVAVVASPGYFSKRARPTRPRDLLEHDCITYRTVSGGDIYRWELTEAGKDIELAVRGRLIVNDGQTMVRAAIDGLGVAHVLESMVERELANGSLTRVLPEYCPPFPGYFLYYPSRKNLAPKVRALVDFLKVKPSAKRPRNAATTTAPRRAL